MRTGLLRRIGGELVVIAAVLAWIGLAAPPLAAEPAAKELPPPERVFDRVNGAHRAR